MILYDGALKPTPPNYQHAERHLFHAIGGELALWSGRAATALYHAYRVACWQKDIATPEVIMPAMMCATAANTALLAGLTPRFADVNEQGLITLASIQARYTPNTVAVVVIHELAEIADIDPIAAWCNAHNLLLIEDITQVLGGVYPDGRALGSVGDMTICSLNPTKIITVGGGVLTANNSASVTTLNAVLEHEALPAIHMDKATQQQLALSYRNLHHSLVGLLRLHAVTVTDVGGAFQHVQPAYQNLYWREAHPDVDMNAAWEQLPASIVRRTELARLYADNLQSDHWILLTGYEQSGVCWRFSLLLNNPDKQVEFSEAVRRDGFHVSNLYWAVNHFFNPDDDCPNADSFGRRIVNLWVDGSVDADYVRRCAASLQRHSKLLDM